MKKRFLPLILLASVATVAYGEEQGAPSDQATPAEVLSTEATPKAEATQGDKVDSLPRNLNDLIDLAQERLKDPSFVDYPAAMQEMTEEMSALCDEVDPESEMGAKCKALMTAIRESLARVQKETNEFIETTATDVE